MSDVNLGGQPRSFTDPKVLMKGVDAYLDECREAAIPPLMLELAIALDITRETMSQYAKGEYDEEGTKPTYSDAFKKARLHCESSKTRQLISGRGSTVGLIFDLKHNHQWSDKSESHVTTENVTTVVHKGMTDEEAQEAYSKQIG